MSRHQRPGYPSSPSTRRSEPSVMRRDDSLSSSILRLSAEAAGDGDLSAPIRLPPTETLTVRLVNLNLLESFDALRSDVSLFQNAFYGAVGCAAGFGGNMLFGTTSTPGWVAFWTSVSLTLVSTLLWIRAAKRAATAKQRMLDEVIMP
jgi:hypothetical protein